MAVSSVAAGHAVAVDVCVDGKSPAADRAALQKALIAHRGESVDAPENTLPAFAAGVDTLTTNCAQALLDS